MQIEKSTYTSLAECIATMTIAMFSREYKIPKEYLQPTYDKSLYEKINGPLRNYEEINERRKKAERLIAQDLLKMMEYKDLFDEISRTPKRYRCMPMLDEFIPYLSGRELAIFKGTKKQRTRNKYYKKAFKRWLYDESINEV